MAGGVLIYNGICTLLLDFLDGNKEWKIEERFTYIMV
jgi:hypothetical protein